MTTRTAHKRKRTTQKRVDVRAAKLAHDLLFDSYQFIARNCFFSPRQPRKEIEKEAEILLDRIGLNTFFDGSLVGDFLERYGNK